MKRKYYAATNQYGSDTSIGFVNTWNVLVFNSEENRDDYVRMGDLSTRAIKKSEVMYYRQSGGRVCPKPFSEEYWGIVNELICVDDEDVLTGYIGHVTVVNPYDYYLDKPERFYK